jgi:hypothetical protein
MAVVFAGAEEEQSAVSKPKHWFRSAECGYLRTTIYQQRGSRIRFLFRSSLHSNIVNRSYLFWPAVLITPLAYWHPAHLDIETVYSTEFPYSPQRTQREILPTLLPKHFSFITFSPHTQLSRGEIRCSLEDDCGSFELIIQHKT